MFGEKGHHYFWSLYDQQGSFWTTQAILMDCRLWGNTLLLPDQMQTVNPVFILVLIFVFESIVYPIVSKFAKITSLRKMIVGGLFASLAFLISAFVQLKVNKTLPIYPSSGNAYVSVVNTLDNCNITATAIGYKPEGVLIPLGKALENLHSDINLFHVKKGSDVKFQFSYTSGCPSILPTEASFNVTNGKVFYIQASAMGMFLAPISTEKPTEANGEFAMSIALAFINSTFDKNLALCRVGRNADHPCNPSAKADFFFYEMDYEGDYGKTSDSSGDFNYITSQGTDNINHPRVFNAKDIRPGHWKLYYMTGNAKGISDTVVDYSGIEIRRLEQGGVYVMSLTGKIGETPTKTDFRAVADNGVSILWQLPQIFVITCAEILFSITGNEFSYTQASPSMKSIAGAFFLLTTFFGDSLIVVLTLIHFTDNMAFLFLVYAILMTIVVLVMALMSIFYFKYTNYTGDDVRDDDWDSEDEEEFITNDSHDSLTKDKNPIFNGDDLSWEVTKF